MPPSMRTASRHARFTIKARANGQMVAISVRVSTPADLMLSAESRYKPFETRRHIAASRELEDERLGPSDFKIGIEFTMGSARWRCTDVGSRTICAIKLDRDDDPSWYDGPPYGVTEWCIDEDDLEACEPI